MLSTAKRGDNVLGSVRPFVRLFEEPVQSVCLCACNQWAYADNRADAVHRFLISNPLETCVFSPSGTVYFVNE